jgi:hypothetical protein
MIDQIDEPHFLKSRNDLISSILLLSLALGFSKLAKLNDRDVKRVIGPDFLWSGKGQD